MRIKFVDESIRKNFFDKLRKSLQKDWKEIYTIFNIPKSTFEKYKSGKLLVPEDLFLDILKYLGDKETSELLRFTERLPDNFGNIKGGKNAYSINFKAFEIGRKKGIDSIRRITNNEIISFDNVSISPQICEFIGAFIGDGCFNSYKNKLYQIEFSGDSRYDLSYYEKIIIPSIKSVFPDIKPHIYIVKNKENTFRVVFYSKKLFYFLRDYIGFSPGKKTYNVRIPDKILKNKLLLMFTIRGIFDTDGGIFIDRRENYKGPYPRIVLQTVSKLLYEQLFSILSKEFNLYARFNEKRQIYIIEIYTINQVKKWMSLIGFSNKRHLNKIASIAQLV